MMQLNGVTTLIFDFGGVLINLKREAAVAKFESLGIKDADALLNNYIQSGVFLQLEEGHINADEFRRTLKEMSSQEISDADIDSALGAFLLDIPQYKLDLLKRLRKRFKLFVLSNTNPIHFPRYKKGGFNLSQDECIEDYFDKLYLSYELNCSKPEPIIFEKLLQDANIHPSEALFLDDGPKNIEVAKSLGFNTYLVAPHEDFTHLFE